MKKSLFTTLFFIFSIISFSQSINKTMLRLPDTGETTSYTSTFGEDNDFTIYAPFFIINGNGTVTDTITGLMWQQTDGGEMTIENATTYCSTLTLASFSDWRLPSAHEAFSILNHQNTNPALNTSIFSPTTAAEYYWTSDKQANDLTKIWATNAGGGIGNHPKSETISAGGIKRFHARAVRNINSPSVISNHFTDNGNGTISDNLTNLIWQKIAYSDSLTWEKSLTYADTLSLNGFTDWRLPNIKELQSINDESLYNPSINTTFFSNIGVKKYWSSTTLPNQTTKAWYLDTQFGITTYYAKTGKINLICVRGNESNLTSLNRDITNGLKNSVFPNPFKSNIHIKVKTDNTDYELFNIFGQLKYSGKNIELHDFSYLENGIYILKITDKSASIIKLIKE